VTADPSYREEVHARYVAAGSPDRCFALPAHWRAPCPVRSSKRSTTTSPITRAISSAISPTTRAWLPRAGLAPARAAGPGAPAALGHPPVPPTPPAWLRHLVLDPGGTLSGWAHHLAHTIAHAAAASALGLAPIAATVVGALLAGWVGARLLRGARAARGPRRSCWLAVGVPAEVDPSGGEAFWRAAAVGLRRGWREVLTARPTVGFELVASASGTRIGLRLPAGVNTAALARALTAAWPGATARIERAGPPLPRGTRAAGGQLRPRGADWLPLTGEPRRGGPDPLRGVFGQLVDLPPDQVAVLAVSARLARRRRTARAHAAAGIEPGRRPWRGVHLLLDMLEGLLGGGRARRTPAAGRPAPDPLRAADARAGLVKLADAPLWEVSVGYAVATTASGFAARRAMRGAAAGIAMGLGCYPGLVSRRLGRPVAALAAGRAGNSFLAGTGELAALAHLPVDAAIAGLVRAGARPVAPPGGLGVPAPRWPTEDDPDDLDPDGLDSYPTGRAPLAGHGDPWSATVGTDPRGTGGDRASWECDADA